MPGALRLPIARPSADSPPGGAATSATRRPHSSLPEETVESQGHGGQASHSSWYGLAEMSSSPEGDQGWAQRGVPPRRQIQAMSQGGARGAAAGRAIGPSGHHRETAERSTVPRTALPMPVPRPGRQRKDMCEYAGRLTMDARCSLALHHVRWHTGRPDIGQRTSPHFAWSSCCSRLRSRPSRAAASVGRGSRSPTDAHCGSRRRREVRTPRPMGNRPPRVEFRVGRACRRPQRSRSFLTTPPAGTRATSTQTSPISAS